MRHLPLDVDMVAYLHHIDKANILGDSESAPLRTSDSRKSTTISSTSESIFEPVRMLRANSSDSAPIIQHPPPKRFQSRSCRRLQCSNEACNHLMTNEIFSLMLSISKHFDEVNNSHNKSKLKYILTKYSNHLKWRVEYNEKHQ